MSQQHHIQKQVVELAFKDAARAYPIQKAIGALCETELSEIIDKHCSTLSPPEAVHHIKALTLELGELDAHNLLEDFTQKFEKALHEALHKHIQPDATESQATQPVEKKAADHLQSIALFIQTGLLPWWAKDKDARAVEARWEYLLENTPLALKALVRQALGQAAHTARMIHHLSDAVLLKTLQALFPQQPPHFAEALYEELHNVLKQTHFPAPKSGETQREALWKALFYTARDTYQEAPFFVKALLSRLAQQQGIDHAATVQAVTRTAEKLQKASFTFKSKLPEWLQALPDDPLPATLAAPLKRLLQELQHPSLAPNATALLQEIRALLTMASTTQGDSSYSALASHLEGVLQQLQRPSLPAGITTLLQDISTLLKQDSAVKADKQLIDRVEAALKQLQRPSMDPDITALLQEIRTLRQQGSAATADKQLASRIEAALKQLQRPSMDPKTSALVQEINKLLQKDEAPELPTEVPFEDVEEVYTESAGLVLLWPYLKQFFEKLGLVADKSFVDEAAAERAVLMLQYLTEGTTETSEHLLALNKLLCGIDLLQPTAIDFEITDTEKADCEALLSAVIGHWPMLKNISLAGFRSAYLQRTGILTIQDGSWLLRVDRQTYDVIVDNIPWPINMVKFPWMNEAIVVTWQQA